ncbi:MAG: hypothetical protein P1U70_09745 [Saprospiraceae bacterium]|nr:hypothetical protein [Saprospiraceae bacterium]
MYELEKLKCVFALDKTTNICYFREKEGWKALNPVVENFNQLKLVVGQVGQIITTQGFYFAGDGGHAKFKVYDFEPTKYNKYTCVKLSNSNYAIRLFEEEVNVLSFGAKGNTDITGKGDDDTIAFQNAIDYISDEGGGFLYIPSKKGRFFKINNLYIKNGVRLRGDISSISQEHNSLIGSKILIKEGGQGLIIGEDKYSPTKRINGVILENLNIQGLDNSISGIRIGSDKSYIAPVNISIENCIIQGFIDSNVNQIVYDKSIEAFGKNDDNFPGTFLVKGACGIFIACGISVSLKKVVSRRNYYGLYESSGGFCTALDFSGGSFSENQKNGIVFTTVKSVYLNNSLVIESNGEEGIKIIAPITTNKELKNGPTNIFINNIHMETNNFKRSSGYSIWIGNKNENYQIKDVFINNNRLDFYKYNGIYISNGRNIDIYSNSIIINPNRIQLKTINSESIEYTGEVSGRMDIDSNTRINRKNKNISNATFGIISDYRTKTTSNLGKEEPLIIQGDIALLPENINSSKGAFNIKVWGRIKSGVPINALKFKFNNHIFAQNNISPTENETWFAEIIISTSNSLDINYSKIITSLQIGKEMESLQIIDINEDSIWEKINRIYITGNAGFEALSIEGYQVIYESN